MSDPYNTATRQSPDQSVHSTTGPTNSPTKTSRPRRSSRSTSHTERSALVPLWNAIAALILLIWAGAKGGVSGLSLTFFMIPLLLAFAASVWVTNPLFATVVRVLNALLAAFVLIKMMRYVNTRGVSAGMPVALVTSVLTPALNAFYLKARSS